MKLKHVDELKDNYIQKFYENIGHNVARLRKEKNISQLELSNLIGYKSTSQIAGSEICYKNYHFNLEQLAKISFVLDVELNEFFKEF
jgi:transcriptional regulator with XRE-family HTH domain